MPCLEETDLTYEGIETPVVLLANAALMWEETDLTYEGIETLRTVNKNIDQFRGREETDLTYEGIETSQSLGKSMSST